MNVALLLPSASDLPRHPTCFEKAGGTEPGLEWDPPPALMDGGMLHPRGSAAEILSWFLVLDSLVFHPIIRQRESGMRPRRGFGILVLAVVLASAWGCGSTATKEGTGEYVDDSVITTKVKAAIFNDPNLKVNEINVETFKGVVQLSGFVRSQADIDKAVQVARGVGGVTSVKNDMRVK